MTIQEAYISYNAAGFAVHPTKPDKSPLMPTDWKHGFDGAAFTNAAGIGVICGKISGGLECLDFDNHFGDAKQVLTDYISIPEVKAIYEKHKLPIEKSMNGGYHLLYRCNVNEGNRKLAQRKNNQGRPEAIIETRGEGGYFCAYPSHGYTIERNNIFHIATITPIERAVLIDTACSFNEYTQQVYKTEFETGDRPGDVYNTTQDAGQNTISLLQSAGWKQIDTYKWRRPDKTDGISATFGKVAKDVFYCFTANGHPFEPNKAYTPFQVLALLKYNGDFKEAAKAIAPERTDIRIPTSKMDVSEIEKILNQAKIDTSKKVERPPVILYIKEQSGTQYNYKRLFTLGNFSCIIGKAKSRKTFLLSMLTAAVINSDSAPKFKSELPKGKAGVLYFDTEQGEYDCYNVISRIETMAGIRSMKSFALREYSPLDRCAIIEHAFKLWGNETAFCVIDGIADLANAINDEEEATRVTTMMLRLTKQYNCHISTVIHQNKNDNFATGHLGSSIMKKAELLISVMKARDNSQMSDVTCDLSRGVDFDPFCFGVNSDGIPEVSGMPVKIAQNGYESDFMLRDEEPPF